MPKLNGKWTTEYGIAGTLDGGLTIAADLDDASKRADWLRRNHHPDAHVVARQIGEWQPIPSESTGDPK